MSNDLPKGYYSDEDSLWVGHPDKDKANLIITPPKMSKLTAEEIVKQIKEGSPFTGGFDEWEGAEMIKDYHRQRLKEEEYSLLKERLNEIEEKLPSHETEAEARRDTEGAKLSALYASYKMVIKDLS